MRIGGRLYTIDWQHLIFLLVVAGAIVAYIVEARSVSLNTNNLLLVQPLTIVGLLLCLLIIPQCFKPAGGPAEVEPAADETMQPEIPKNLKELIPVALLAGALGIMVLLLDVVGFDTGIWAFATAAMWICGERRPLMLLVLPALMTVIAIYGFKALMPYPMATSIL